MYVFSTGYGLPYLDSNYALIQPPSIAPEGPDGRLAGRGVAVYFRHAGAVTVRVTPIVDFYTELGATEQTFASSGGPRLSRLHASFARTATWFSFRAQIISNDGTFTWAGASLIVPAGARVAQPSVAAGNLP